MYMSEEEVFNPEYFQEEPPMSVISEPLAALASSGQFPSSPPKEKAGLEVKDESNESDGVGKIVFKDEGESVKFWKKNFIKRIMGNKRKPEGIDAAEVVEELFADAEYDNDPGTVLHKLYERGILNPGAQNKHEANDWSKKRARQVAAEFYEEYINNPELGLEDDEKVILRAALVDGAPSIICSNGGKYTKYAICLTHIEAGERDGKVEKLLIKAFTHGLLTPGGSTRQFQSRVMYRHLRDIMEEVDPVDPTKNKNKEEINTALKSILTVWRLNMKEPGEISEPVKNAIDNGICYRDLFYKNIEELRLSPAGKEKRIGYRPKKHPTLLATHPGNSLEEILKGVTDKEEVKTILENFSGPLSVEPSPFVDNKSFMGEENPRFLSFFYKKKGEIVRNEWYKYENNIRKGEFLSLSEEETEAKNFMINIFINAFGLHLEHDYGTINFFLNDNDWNLDNTLNAYLNTTKMKLAIGLGEYNVGVELRKVEVKADKALKGAQLTKELALSTSQAYMELEDEVKEAEEILEQAKEKMKKRKRDAEEAALDAEEAALAASKAAKEAKIADASVSSANQAYMEASQDVNDLLEGRGVLGGGKKNTRRKNTRRKNTRRKNTSRKNTRRKNTRRKNTRRKNTRRKNTRRKNTRRKR